MVSMMSFFLSSFLENVSSCGEKISRVRGFFFFYLLDFYDRRGFPCSLSLSLSLLSLFLILHKTVLCCLVTLPCYFFIPRREKTLFCFRGKKIIPYNDAGLRRQGTSCVCLIYGSAVNQYGDRKNFSGLDA